MDWEESLYSMRRAAARLREMAVDDPESPLPSLTETAREIDEEARDLEELLIQSGELIIAPDALGKKVPVVEQEQKKQP